MNIEKIGLKEDKGKSRIDLIPAFVLLNIGDVLAYGAKKYKPNSWQNVKDGKDVHYAAAMRHLLTWRDGEIYDNESKLPHLSHALTNIIFCMYHQKEEDKNGNSKRTIY